MYEQVLERHPADRPRTVYSESAGYAHGGSVLVGTLPVSGERLTLIPSVLVGEPLLLGTQTGVGNGRGGGVRVHLVQ